MAGFDRPAIDDLENMTDSFWKKIRKDFSIAKNYTYLDHAAGGPLPKPVSKAIDEHQNLNADHCDFAWPKWVKHREVVRKKVAKFIHAEPEEIAFVNGTSDGMNHVADLIAREGGVLTNTSEFPSSTVPWIWRQSKITWQKPKGSKVDLKDLKKLLSPSTKTILSSYVQYGTGYRQDLEELGRLKKNRFFVVNATQGFGALPINVQKWNADFMVTNSYKWMLAGYGGGILYIRKKWLKKFKPGDVGWRSAQNPDLMDNRKMNLAQHAMRYEMGCPNFPVIYAIGAAVDYFSGIGVKKIEKRILSLTDYLIGKLESKGYSILSSQERKHRSGIVVFEAKDKEKLWKKLLSKKIFVSLRGGGVRVAPHFYNNEEDIDRLVKQL